MRKHTRQERRTGWTLDELSRFGEHSQYHVGPYGIGQHARTYVHHEFRAKCHAHPLARWIGGVEARLIQPFQVAEILLNKRLKLTLVDLRHELIDTAGERLDGKACFFWTLLQRPLADGVGG